MSVSVPACSTISAGTKLKLGCYQSFSSSDSNRWSALQDQSLGIPRMQNVCAKITDDACAWWCVRSSGKACSEFRLCLLRAMEFKKVDNVCDLLRARGFDDRVTQEFRGEFDNQRVRLLEHPWQWHGFLLALPAHARLSLISKVVSLRFLFLYMKTWMERPFLLLWCLKELHWETVTFFRPSFSHSKGL